MDISAVSTVLGVQGSGLQATSSAIQQAQGRFDDVASKLVDDTVSGDVGSAEVNDAVALQTESLHNQILYSVFSRQAEQQKSVMDMLGAGTRG